jgi:predicted O-linked N-acetylglucosamine transferase (SPINDLY family)
MQSYAAMDIALDTYPFNGAMTSFDALWMGVPLVSRFAELPASRQGLSILKAIDLEQMAVNSDSDYIDQVCKLANDIEKRTELKNQLRNRLRSSPLMDASAFAQHWLAAIRQAIDLQLEATPR